MSLDRIIILENDRSVAAAISLINGNWRPMQAAGATLAVRVYQHKERASDAQRGLYWLRVSELAEQAWVGGRQYSPETWHQFLKEQHLPEEDGPSKSTLKGYRKWDYLPNGERALIGSTEKLTTFGKAEYQDRIEQFAAEQGVRMSAKP